MEIIHGDKLLEELKNGPLDRAVQPVNWLIGKWHSVLGQASLFLEEFETCTQLTFTSYGEPVLNYFGAYWDFETKTLQRIESGFLRVEPGTCKMSFLVNHSNGLSSLEEGELSNPYCFKVIGKKFQIPSGLKKHFNKEGNKYTSIEREFTVENDLLHYYMNIETDLPFHNHEFTYLLKKIA